jgi:endonuclease-3
MIGARGGLKVAAGYRNAAGYHRPAMPEDSAPDPSRRRNARTVLGRLKKRYPEIGTALEYRDPWQLLVSTVLSAQTTDENVNKVTPVLFRRWPGPDDLGAADPEEVEEVVFSTGFYRQKAKSIIALSQDLVDRFEGNVPADLDSLVELRGVGRKTASVVLAEAFGVPAIAVDTHVKRVTRRLGLVAGVDPDRIEVELRALYPEREWSGISMRFIQFGRDVCEARRPRCWECPLADRCRYPDKTPPPA